MAQLCSAQAAMTLAFRLRVSANLCPGALAGRIVRRMTRTPPSPQASLKRQALRACRWLAQLLIVLPVFERIAPKRARIWLDQRLTILENFALDFIFFHAAHLRPAPSRLRNHHQIVQVARRHDVRMQVRFCLRATIGGELRRALKARGFKARASAILFALRNAAILAARLARRAGLSRRFSAHSRVLAGSATLIAAVFCDMVDLVPCADTS
jgi:hypothetical protein